MSASLALRGKRQYNTWVKTNEGQITANKLHAAGALVQYNPCMEKEVKHYDVETEDPDQTAYDDADKTNVGFFLCNPGVGRGANQRESNGVINLMLFMRLHLMKQPGFYNTTDPKGPSNSYPYFHGTDDYQPSVRVIIFSDEAARGVLSDWINTASPTTPGPLSRDDFDSFYNDSEESRYRIFYDCTFTLNDLGSGIMTSHDSSSGVVTFYSLGADSFIDERISLNGITTTFSMFQGNEAPEARPNTNGLQCLVRTNSLYNGAVRFKAAFRTEFVDSS